MGIPGMNLHNMAMTLITKQTVQYVKYLSRVRNAEGIWVPNYAKGMYLSGSFQPVPRRLYQQWGLDLQKNYATFYTSTQLQDVQRDMSCDQIYFGGKAWAVESSNDWFAVDGWVGVLVVEVTPEEFVKRFNDRFSDRFV